MRTEVIVPIITAIGTLLASPGILRGLRVLGETRKARIAAHVEEAKAPIQAELDRFKAERAALDDSWASYQRVAVALPQQLERLATENASLYQEVSALRREVASLREQVAEFTRIEERCEVLEAENRALREKDRAREAEVQALRARVQELEAA